MGKGEKKPAKRTNPHNKLIAELQELVITRQEQVSKLSEERRGLRARAAMAQALVANCTALANLAEALAHRRTSKGPACGTCSQGSSCGDCCPAHNTAAAAAAVGAAEATTAEAQQWQDELARMRSELEAACGSHKSGSSDASDPGEPLLTVQWWPGGLAHVDPGGCQQHTLKGFRDLVLDCLRHFGCILP